MEKVYRFEIPKRKIPAVGRGDECRINFLESKNISGFPGGGFDMLRYDRGRITGETPESYHIEALGCTEGRWNSFGIAPKNIQSTKVRKVEYDDRKQDITEWQCEFDMDYLVECGKDRTPFMKEDFSEVKRCASRLGKSFFYP